MISIAVYERTIVCQKAAVQFSACMSEWSDNAIVLESGTYLGYFKSAEFLSTFKRIV